VSVLLLVLALVGVIAAQSPSTPTFRARTELVRLDVRVTDAHGDPVGDVRPDEVVVTENGQVRPVLLFRHLCDEHGTDDHRAASGELSTNAMPSPGHLYVLVFDQLHLARGEDQRARLAAAQFIERALGPGDAVAVYGLPGPGPVVNLTTDLQRARDALVSVRGQASPTPRRGAPIADLAMARGLMANGEPGPPSLFPVPALDPSTEVSNVLQGAGDEMVPLGEAEVNIFLSSLARVMRPLRWIEGRKNVILFSGGFPADHLSTRLEQVAAAAAESYSVIYPVSLDTPGLDIEHMVPASAGATLARTSERRDPLAALAVETDGRLVANTNAQTLPRALNAIVAEAEDYYLVGFEPAPASAAKAYSRVNVQVKRRDLVVRARTGYAAPDQVSPAAERQAIDAALTSPKVSRGVPIEFATYERLGPAPDRARVILCMTAHVRALREDETADVVFVVRDSATGQVVASGSDHIRVAGSRAAGVGALADVPYRVQFDVTPGEYWMRVLVRDPGGVVGTADRRFHVWSLAGPGVTTSDLIVTRLDGARFDPPTQATVQPKDNVLAYLEVYGQAAAVQAATARVDILRLDSGQVVASTEPVSSAGSSGERIVRASLPVSGLPPGEYAARVRVTVPNQAPRTMVRSFTVGAGDH
jgi:VWFA-related protein